MVEINKNKMYVWNSEIKKASKQGLLLYQIPDFLIKVIYGSMAIWFKVEDEII